MTYETILYWLVAGITSFLFIVFQAMVIVGLKLASDGKTEILPNGEEKDSEMLLYPVKKYLNQSKPRTIYYTEERLEKVLELISQTFGSMDIKPSMVYRQEFVYSDPERFQVFKMLAPRIERHLGVKTVTNHDNTGFLLYIEEKRFKFSKWLRLPILGCVTCMPSFWSLVLYWIPVVLCFGFVSAEVPLWIVDVCAVSAISTLLYKKIKNAD